MDLKKAYGTDKELEQEGTWIPLGEGLTIKVARSGNKKHKEVLKRLVAPHKVAFRNNKVSEEITDKITIQSMAEGILLDWKGLSDDGKVIKYSVENAVDVLTKYPDFRDQVAAISTDIANYQKESEAVATKN